MTVTAHADTILIGFGRWGTNLARALHHLKRLAVICDTDPQRRAQARALYPDVSTAASIHEVSFDGLTCAVIATPTPDHVPTTRTCLQKGLHTFVEKPLSLHSAEALDLGALALERNLVLAVDHLIEYHPCLRPIYATLAAHRHRVGFERALWPIGQHLEHIQATRINTNSPPQRRLGPILHDLAVHDLGVLLRLLEASGATLPDTLRVTLMRETPNDADCEEAELHISWIDPMSSQERTAGILVGRWAEDAPKVRTLEVHSPTHTILFEDGPEPRLALVDRASHTPIALPYASGEPLVLTLQAFFHNVDNPDSSRPLSNNALHAVRIARILEAAQTFRHQPQTPAVVHIPHTLHEAPP